MLVTPKYCRNQFLLIREQFSLKLPQQTNLAVMWKGYAVHRGEFKVGNGCTAEVSYWGMYWS